MWLSPLWVGPASFSRRCRGHKFAASIALCLIVLIAGGCGGGSKTSGDGTGGRGSSHLAITTTALPAGQLLNDYSATLTASGGTPPYVWSLTSGKLQQSLSLDSATGVIAGTAREAAADSLTFKVTDAGSPQQAATANLTLTINGFGPLTSTTSSLPQGQVGQPYDAYVNVEGGTPPYTVQEITNALAVFHEPLPLGLTLTTLSGESVVIEGTPTQASSSYVYFTVLDSSMPPNYANFDYPLTILPAPNVPLLQITTMAVPGGVVGMPYSTALAATGGTGPHTWAVIQGALPGGLSLDPASGTISGTPLTDFTEPGLSVNYWVTVSATDSGNPTQAATMKLALTIGAAGAPLSVVNTSFDPNSFASTLPEGLVGTPYRGTLEPLGGTPPYTWAVADGSLPPGLSLTASTGEISGTPTVSGPYLLMVSVTDSGTPAQSALGPVWLVIYGSAIGAAPPLSVTTTSLPSGTVGSPYNATALAAGGVQPYRAWSCCGTNAYSLPSGLTMNAATGTITGTPTVAGVSSFYLGVADSNYESVGGTDAYSGQLSLTIVAAGAPLTIWNTSLPTGTEGTAYSTTLAASGGTAPYTWALTSGTLPDALTLNPSTGLISGTPTTAGSSALTFAVTDSGNPAQSASSVSLTLTLASPTMIISTTSLPDGTQATPYTATLEASGGTAPYSWSLTTGTLPGGLVLNTGTGGISGTPTAGGYTSSLTFSLTDSSVPAQTEQVTLPLIIMPSATPIISTSGYLGGAVGSPYSATLSAYGGTPPYTWSVSGGTLPAGLSLNATTGVISGTPTALASEAVAFAVTDSSMPVPTRSTVVLIFTIDNSTFLKITTSSLPIGTVGSPHNATILAVGGLTPYTWWVNNGALPAGLTLDPVAGTITGTPTQAGSSTFQIGVQDSALYDMEEYGNEVLTLTIASSP